MTAPKPPTLVALLDTLIPPVPERGLAGAGGLGVGDAITERAAGLLPALEPLLADLEARGFGALSPAEREALLRDLAPEPAGLLRGLLFQALSAYYTHPAVVAGLGVEPRPPHPEGYPLEPGDLGGLEAVRARGPIYRST